MRKNRFVVWAVTAVMTLSSALAPMSVMAEETESAETAVEASDASSQEVSVDSSDIEVNNGWAYIGNRRYWLENGVIQGTYSDPLSVKDGFGITVGREIYDSIAGKWYWLNAAEGGAMAYSNDGSSGEVRIPYVTYSEYSWTDFSHQNPKWVRYDSNGGMIMGWFTNNKGTYYYDEVNGAMHFGKTTVDGKSYYFDDQDGLMKKGWYTNSRGETYYLDPTTGEMAIGRKAIDGQWYTFDANGKMFTVLKRTSGQTVYTAQNFMILYEGYEWTSTGFDIKLQVRNYKDHTIGIQLRDFSINSITARVSLSTDVPRITALDVRIHVPSTVIANRGLNNGGIQYTDFSFDVYDNASSSTVTFNTGDIQIGF